MIKIVELNVAQATLAELISSLGPDDHVLITRNQIPVAKLTTVSENS